MPNNRWILALAPFAVLAAATLWLDSHRPAQANWRTVYGPLLLAAQFLLAQLLLLVAMTRGGRPKLELADLLISTMWALGLGCGLLAVNARLWMWALPAFLGVAVAVFGFRAAWVDVHRRHEPAGPSSDPQHWYGSIYFNPDDPAGMVTQRGGIGWALNFAHGISWLAAALFFLTPPAFYWIFLR